VVENLKTLQKQLFTAEDKIAAIDLWVQPADSTDGLPLTEITEELDDEDNVICQSESVFLSLR
jgi:unconventional prefoldin RPB5 interactor 1